MYIKKERKMLISLKANNCLIYNSDIEFSLRADMRIKHFQNNVFTYNKNNILKSAVIIGPNNTGKTNLVKILNMIKQIMLNQNPQIQKNLFKDNNITEICISFLENEHEYSFEVKYDSAKKEYIYEKFSEIFHDIHNNTREEILLLRDTINNKYDCVDTQVVPNLKIASKNNILIHLLDTSNFQTLNIIKQAMFSFGERIDIIDMNNIPIKKTIDMLKLENEKKQKIVNFILNSDLSLQDFKYLSDEELKITISENDTIRPQEAVLNTTNQILEMLHLTSVYKGISVPSLLYDSTGTKKMAAIASYVIDALDNNRILIIDELDNSLHFKLTRAIIAMFNNELNISSQLIATVHDVSLLDCQTLFRKDQIWFSHKDLDNAYLYPLSDFTAAKDKTRSTSDLIEQYKRGVFGALPEPNLYQSLLEIKENGKTSKD